MGCKHHQNARNVQQDTEHPWIEARCKHHQNARDIQRNELNLKKSAICKLHQNARNIQLTAQQVLHGSSCKRHQNAKNVQLLQKASNVFEVVSAIKIQRTYSVSEVFFRIGYNKGHTVSGKRFLYKPKQKQKNDNHKKDRGIHLRR